MTCSSYGDAIELLQKKFKQVDKEVNKKSYKDGSNLDLSSLYVGLQVQKSVLENGTQTLRQAIHRAKVIRKETEELDYYPELNPIEQFCSVIRGKVKREIIQNCPIIF
jgi:hypothetical protein